MRLQNQRVLVAACTLYPDGGIAYQRYAINGRRWYPVVYLNLYCRLA